MLQLDAAHVQALQALKRQRDLAALGTALGQAFPDVLARLGERHAALVALAAERGSAHGLNHLLCLGRYAACWCVLGAEFEQRPGFEWARALLADPARSDGAKVFQLCRRTREQLAAQPPAPTAVADFDAALALLDAALRERGALGSLLPVPPPQLGAPCDIDALELRLLPPAAGPLQRYAWREGQWRREALPGLPVAPLLLTAGGTEPPLLPADLHLLSQPADRDYARLRLRLRAEHSCDATHHPFVSHLGPLGRHQWQGAMAIDLSLPLYAPSAVPAHDGPQPAIAADAGTQASLLTVGACGIREAGQPLGEQTLRLTVHGAEQHLMHWQRQPGAALHWPHGTPAAPPPPQLRLERDGQPLDPSRWLAGLQDLDRQLAEGLGRLATAWERESGVRQGRLAVEPAVMSGSAGLAWGLAPAADPAQAMTAPPFMRLAAHLDLIACQLRLRFDGALALHGSATQLTLSCQGRALLRADLERRSAADDALALLQTAATAFRFPFVLQLQPQVVAGRPATLDLAGPVSGAIVGAAGLRPRAAGPGLQWFCHLAVEAVSAPLQLNDPLLGQRRLTRPLLPAMPLLDWSLG